jgi:hypothetical protein
MVLLDRPLFCHTKIKHINYVLDEPGVGLAADLSLRLRFEFLFEYI